MMSVWSKECSAESTADWPGRIVFRFEATLRHKGVKTERQGWPMEMKIVVGNDYDTTLDAARPASSSSMPLASPRPTRPTPAPWRAGPPSPSTSSCWASPWARATRLPSPLSPAASRASTACSARPTARKSPKSPAAPPSNRSPPPSSKPPIPTRSDARQPRQMPRTTTNQATRN